MTRLPERIHPKDSIVIYTEAEILTVIDAYAYRHSNIFRSKSHFFETLIILMFVDCCEAEPPIRFLKTLQDVGQEYDSKKMLTGAVLPKERLHVSLDINAKEYVHLVVKKYPTLFKTQSRFFLLLLLYAKSFMKSNESIEYFEGRLKEAMEKFPSRADKKWTL